jgi:hypothetical protein
MAAGRADAGLLVESEARCDEQALSRPFLPWLDVAAYTPVPDGSFSGRANGWELSRAEVVDGNEPWNVSRETTAASLRVDADGTATSPEMCVGIAHPTLRFFAKRVGASTAPLHVDVLFADANGQKQSLRIATVSGHASWSPTLPLPILVNLLTLVPGDETSVAFSFTSPRSDGAWLIDDVYVDPYKKG